MPDITSYLIKDLFCFQQTVVNQVYAPFTLILYAHLPTAFISLLVGIYIFWKDKEHLASRIFFLLTLLFFVFTMGDLAEWFMFIGHGPTMFARAAIEMIDPMLFLTSFYFLYVMVKKADAPFWGKLIYAVPLIPIFARAVLNWNLVGYNWSICEVVESDFSAAYIYYLDLFYLISILVFAGWQIIRNTERRKEIAIACAGICSFVILFFITEYVLTGYVLGLAFDYTYFLYAFFGMPLLIAFLAYLIVRYHAFDIKLFGAQALVIALLFIIAAEYAFVQSNINRILISVTLIITSIIGSNLIKSVRKEIEARERIEKLAGELKEANEGQANLLHIINHQIKGYMTKARYVFDDLMEDTSYGLSEKARPMVEQGYASVTEGVNFVQDFLNASNIEKGTYSYAMVPMDLKEVAEQMSVAQKENAAKKGLEYSFTVADGDYKMVGDKAQLGQAVRNLIDNSINYTPKGWVKAELSRQGDKILFKVADSGVGLSEEVKPKLFTKGGRDKDSQKININSTGFGLAFVKGVAEAHKGRVWAESEGPGKGSAFYMELQAA